MSDLPDDDKAQRSEAHHRAEEVKKKYAHQLPAVEQLIREHGYEPEQLARVVGAAAVFGGTGPGSVAATYTAHHKVLDAIAGLLEVPAGGDH